MCSILIINKLHFSLNHLQGKKNYEIGANFDCSSIDENDFFDFTCHHFWDLSRKIDPRPVFTCSPTRKFLDSSESISFECGDSSLPFNGDPISSSCGIKGSTSLASNYIDVSVTSEEETFKTFCPNHHDCHSNLEFKVETSVIACFDPNSSDHHDPSGHKVKESEAKVILFLTKKNFLIQILLRSTLILTIKRLKTI